MNKVAGNLTIISRENTARTTKYICECSCGNRINLTKGQLNKIKVRSCGCIPNGLLDKRGQKFNKLTVLNYHSCKNESHLWECICDCGNNTLVSTSDLSTGHKKSCGCLSKLPKGQAALNTHFRIYTKGAASRGYDFNLTKGEFKSIVSDDCHYCGESPKYKTSKDFTICNGNIKVNGIDRKDNTVGYVLDNCVPCCDSCNFLKGPMGYDDFITLCKKITDNLDSGS